MGITPQEVKHVADLARLRIADKDIERLAEQLDAILAYMEKLNTVDTRGVAATAQAGALTNAFREDRLRDSLPREQALANAPEAQEGSFIVPKVIGG
jgi:aspartyl-tRNA(Asn)/glutamyl-tRNA(Gln) amidotransferase subunit C